MSNVQLPEELIKVLALFIRNIIDVDSDVIAESSGNLLQRQLGGFGEKEVNNRDKDDAPNNNYQVVFPTNMYEPDGGCLKQNDGAGELAKERESHADWADLCWKDF